MKKILFVVTLFCFVACSSPEGDGKKSAQEEIDAQKEYVDDCKKELRKVIDKIDSHSYTTRVEVREEAEKVKKEAYEEFEEKLEELAVKKAKRYNKYLTDYENATKFMYAYNSYYDYNSLDFYDELSWVYEQLNEKILTIIPPHPDVEKIKRDLIGRRVVGVDGDYFGLNWYWTFEEGEIKQAEIVNADSAGDSYNMDVKLRVQASGAMYEFEVILKYVLGDYDDWRIDIIETKSVSIVKTGRYNNCVSCRVTGNSYERSLEITNLCDVKIIVGGEVQGESNGEWKKFVKEIKANDKASVGCWFFFSVKDYRIDFVEKDE